MASEVQAKLGGKWKVYKSENFEAFVDAMGIGFPKKQVVMNSTPTMTIVVEGDTIKLTMDVGPKTNKVAFKLGEEFEAEEGPMKGKGVSTFEGNKMTTLVKPSDAKKSDLQMERELVGDEIVQTMTIGSVVTKRYFKREK